MVFFKKNELNFEQLVTVKGSCQVHETKVCIFLFLVTQYSGFIEIFFLYIFSILISNKDICTNF